MRSSKLTKQPFPIYLFWIFPHFMQVFGAVQEFGNGLTFRDQHTSPLTRKGFLEVYNLKRFILITMSALVVSSIIVITQADASSQLSPSTIEIQVKEPNQIVVETSRRILNVLDNDAEKLEKDPLRLQRMVEEILVPVIDLRMFSKLLLSQHWRKASTTQRERFTREFKGMLIRTYTKYLVDYSGTQVKVLPNRGAQKNPKRQLVHTEVVQPGKSPLPVNYSFWFHNNKWRAYNVTVDGLSLVHLFRSEFNREITETSLDALIDRLAKTNLK